MPALGTQPQQLSWARGQGSERSQRLSTAAKTDSLTRRAKEPKRACVRARAPAAFSKLHLAVPTPSHPRARSCSLASTCLLCPTTILLHGIRSRCWQTRPPSSSQLSRATRGCAVRNRNRTPQNCTALLPAREVCVCGAKLPRYTYMVGTSTRFWRPPLVARKLQDQQEEDSHHHHRRRHAPKPHRAVARAARRQAGLNASCSSQRTSAFGRWSSSLAAEGRDMHTLSYQLTADSPAAKLGLAVPLLLLQLPP